MSSQHLTFQVLLYIIAFFTLIPSHTAISQWQKLNVAKLQTTLMSGFRTKAYFKGLVSLFQLQVLQGLDVVFIKRCGFLFTKLPTVYYGPPQRCSVVKMTNDCLIVKAFIYMLAKNGQV